MTMRQDCGGMAEQIATKEVLATASWPGGKVSFRCIGVDCDSEAPQAVTEALEQLASGWHLMFIWFVGVLKRREDMQKDVAENIGRDELVSFGCEYPDGSRRYIRTRVKCSDVVASFSDEMFGKLHAKSFVLSTFSHWEDTIRPRIVNALGVPIREAESDIMGEWRLLRNWLQHPASGGDAEQQYFSRARVLARLLGSQRGKPEITVGDAFSLMDQLNALSITVNPLKQEPIVRFVRPEPETLAKIQEQIGPNGRILSW